jgi:hypothetical protein
MRFKINARYHPTRFEITCTGANPNSKSATTRNSVGTQGHYFPQPR